MKFSRGALNYLNFSLHLLHLTFKAQDSIRQQQAAFHLDFMP